MSIGKSLDNAQKGLRNEKIRTLHIKSTHRGEKPGGISAVLLQPWHPQVFIHTSLLPRDSKQSQLNV